MRDRWNIAPLLSTMDKRGKYLEVRKILRHNPFICLLITLGNVVRGRIHFPREYLGRALSRIVCEEKSRQGLPFCHDLDKFPLEK
jgi:hypothetical protein